MVFSVDASHSEAATAGRKEFESKSEASDKFLEISNGQKSSWAIL
jgi:hypothetical protein